VADPNPASSQASILLARILIWAVDFDVQGLLRSVVTRFWSSFPCLWWEIG